MNPDRRTFCLSGVIGSLTGLLTGKTAKAEIQQPQELQKPRFVKPLTLVDGHITTQIPIIELPTRYITSDTGLSHSCFMTYLHRYSHGTTEKASLDVGLIQHKDIKDMLVWYGKIICSRTWHCGLSRCKEIVWEDPENTDPPVIQYLAHRVRCWGNHFVILWNSEHKLGVLKENCEEVLSFCVANWDKVQGAQITSDKKG